MRWTIPLLLVSVSWTAAQEPPDTNYDETKVPKFELPDPLVCFDGRRVTDAAMWQNVRRPEILRAFATHIFGRTPDLKSHLRFETTGTDTKALDGLATRKEIRIRLFEADEAPSIDLLLYVPNVAAKPVPVFLGLNYGNQGVHPDPGISPSRNAVCQRGEHAHRWPLQLLLNRGYAVASFHGGDIELDRHGSGCRYTTEGWRKGLRYFVLQQEGGTELADDEWGSIGVWAWGLSRALDYLQHDPAIDGNRVAVFGHSRTGKTAPWAAAQDERFALAISNNSGQGGASLARRRYGESVAASYALSGIWYCRNYRRYGNNESALPVDAHLLIALIAPRRCMSPAPSWTAGRIPRRVSGGPLRRSGVPFPGATGTGGCRHAGCESACRSDDRISHPQRRPRDHSLRLATLPRLCRPAFSRQLEPRLSKKRLEGMRNGHETIPGYPE